MNICEHLSATARIFPDRDAIRFEGTSLTYTQLDRMSLAASRKLSDAGLRPGDRVAIMLANVPAFAVWYYAALRVGGIAVSISTRSAPTEVAFLVDDSAAKVFISDEVTLGKVQRGLPKCIENCVWTSDMGDQCNGDSIGDLPDSTSDWFDAHPNDPALILYTSGTTGFAKGATLSHSNVRTNVNAFNHLCDMQPHDRILLAVPLFHCFGQNALLNSVLNAGATLVLQRRFDLNEAKRLIAEERVTQLYGVPMMFQLLLESCEPGELASVDYCFSAAAKLPIQIGEQWRQKFGMPINEGYGLTETSPFASYNHRLKFRSGSIGTAIDGVEMKIVDTESGQNCPPGELGEIVVRGPNVMLGYWNREEDTNIAIRDGWFHSGDIGRVDDDGYFYIVDRVKDMISVGGLKVFPAEVERVLLDHKVVNEVAVVGIHDDVFGEQVVAFVVLNQELESNENSLEAVKQFAKNQLANYKVPRIVVQIDELPRNPSGKVLKRELREYDLSQADRSVPSEFESSNSESVAAAQSASENLSQNQLRAPSLRDELAKTHPAGRERVAINFVQQLVHAIAETETLPNPDDGFLDAGLDSLMIVEMSNQIQVELGSDHSVPATLVFDYPRVRDLSDFLLETIMPGGSEASSPTMAIEQTVELRGDVESMSEDEALAELMKELDS